MRGLQTLLMDFYDNPRFVHDLLNAIADYNIAQIQESLKYDIDAVMFGMIGASSADCRWDRGSGMNSSTLP